MSERDIIGAADYMDKSITAILRYIELSREGDYNKLIAVVALAFNIKRDTARERLMPLRDAGIIQVTNNKWKYHENGVLMEIQALRDLLYYKGEKCQEAHRNL